MLEVLESDLVLLGRWVAIDEVGMQSCLERGGLRFVCSHDTEIGLRSKATKSFVRRSAEDLQIRFCMYVDSKPALAEPVCVSGRHICSESNKSWHESVSLR